MRAVSARPQRALRQRPRSSGRRARRRAVAGRLRRAARRARRRAAPRCRSSRRRAAPVPARRIRRSARAPSRSGVPDSSSVMPGRPTAPPSVTSIEPGSPFAAELAEPVRRRGARSARCWRASRRSGRASGVRARRRSNGRGGTKAGFAGPPFSHCTSAVSSPATKRSGTRDELDPLARARAARARRSRAARLACALAASRPTAITICARAHGGCRRHGAVEHEVRIDPHQQLVLVARRLALDAVGDHDGRAARGDRAQLEVRREARAAASAQPARLDGRDAAPRPRRAARAGGRSARCARPATAASPAGGEQARQRLGARARVRTATLMARPAARGREVLGRAAGGALSRRSATAPPKIAMQVRIDREHPDRARRRCPCRRRAAAPRARRDRPA